MSRRTWIAIAIGLLVLISVPAYLYRSACQTPDFYREIQARTKSPDELRLESKRFVQGVVELAQNARREPQWVQEFFEEDINAWLEDELPTKYPQWLPSEFSHPRIHCDGESLWLAGTLKRSYWQGVISCRLKPWITKTNQIALEIERVQAGQIPIPVDSLLEKLVDRARNNGWQIRWNQAGRHDVLVLHLDEKLGSDLLIEQLSVEQGKIMVSGRRKPSVVADLPRANPR